VGDIGIFLPFPAWRSIFALGLTLLPILRFVLLFLLS